MATPQGGNPSPVILAPPVPWWRRLIPTVTTTTDKALDEGMAPAAPRVGSWQEQKPAGLRWMIVEWLFRF